MSQHIIHNIIHIKWDGPYDLDDLKELSKKKIMVFIKFMGDIQYMVLMCFYILEKQTGKHLRNAYLKNTGVGTATRKR